VPSSKSRRLKPQEVTAVVVPQGGEDAFLNTLIFPQGIVWDTASNSDWGAFTRYAIAQLAAYTPVVYVQGADVIVPRKVQRALVRAYEDGKLVMTEDGLEHGALFDRGLPLAAFKDRDVQDPEFWPQADTVFLEWARDRTKTLR
jgi:hypothetical protein